MSRRTIVAALVFALAACDSAKAPTTSTPPAAPPSNEGPKGAGEGTAKAPDAKPDPKPAPTPPEDPQEPPPVEDRFPKDEAFVVAPVEGEPSWPDPADEKEVAKRGFVSFPGGYHFELRDAGGAITQAGVVVKGTILLDRGILELFGCAEWGKEHESALRLECEIQAFDLALQFSGLKRGPIPVRLNDPSVAQGSRVLVFLQWTGEDGKTITHRAEDCIIDLRRRTPMPRVGWTYVGAMIPIQDPAAGPGKTFRVLAATGSRSLMTTYRDGSTILDNPLEATELDMVNDTAYAANHMVLPEPGTRIRVIIRSPDEKTRKEIAKLEEGISK